jgi:hypothetical protein
MGERKRIWETIGPSNVERYALVGMALDHVQSVEGMLKMVMTYVFQKGDRLDIFLLETQTNAERKKTLGYFIGELRKRVGLDPDFEAKLTSFLEHRNTLAHRLDDVPGWELGAEAGFNETRAFLTSLIKDSHELLMIFAALVRAWQREAMPDAQFPHDEAVAQMTERYAPLLDDLFVAKVEPLDSGEDAIEVRP